MKNESKQINKISKIGFGGGCHWCTEAVFQSLKGVVKVEQGWIKSSGYATTFSEAVIVHYMPKKITLDSLIEIHLLTHSSTSDHSMREKYRSAVYYFSKKQKENTNRIILNLQVNFKNTIITKAYAFKEFRASSDNHKGICF